MEKTIMFIIPIFFLILIIGFVSLTDINIFYLETTGKSTKEFQDAEIKRMKEEGLKRDTYYVDINHDGSEPKFINGTRGCWVIFTNNDTETHRLLTEFGDIDTGDIKPGDSFKKYFSNSGEYIFTDKYNPDLVIGIYIGVEFYKK